jgi:hypothetical protein
MFTSVPLIAGASPPGRRGAAAGRAASAGVCRRRRNGGAQNKLGRHRRQPIGLIFRPYGASTSENSSSPVQVTAAPVRRPRVCVLAVRLA